MRMIRVYLNGPPPYHPRMRTFRRPLLALAFALFTVAPAVAAEPEALLQLVDYIAVDYTGAVADGQVISAAEYAEMKEFAARTSALVAALPEGEAKRQAQPAAAALAATIDARGAIGEVRAAT